MKWYTRFLFTVAFVSSWLLLVSVWEKEKLPVIIIGIVCAVTYTILFWAILTDLYLEARDWLVDRYRLYRSAQKRRTRYRLFRHWTKTGLISEEYFEDQARKVIK